MDFYYTKYETNYCVCRANFKNMMPFSVAEELGKEYCKENNYEYLGTHLQNKDDNEF